MHFLKQEICLHIIVWFHWNLISKCYCRLIPAVSNFIKWWGQNWPCKKIGNNNCHLWVKYLQIVVCFCTGLMSSPVHHTYCGHHSYNQTGHHHNSQDAKNTARRSPVASAFLQEKRKKEHYELCPIHPTTTIKQSTILNHKYKSFADCTAPADHR